MAQAYGTVMIGRLAAPFDEVEAAVRRWADERRVPGFEHEDIMLCDDGETVVMTVRFASREQYEALSADRDQAAWWETVAAPMFAGAPQWLDGHWRAAIDA